VDTPLKTPPLSLPLKNVSSKNYQQIKNQLSSTAVAVAVAKVQQPNVSCIRSQTGPANILAIVARS